MKILAIGDFHGKFPKKLENLAKKSDLVISLGDYFPGYSVENFLIEELFRLISGEEIQKIPEKDEKQVRTILKKLNSLKKPVLTTIGNYDNHNSDDSTDSEKGKDFFSNIIKDYPKIRRIDYKTARIGELVFIGAYGSSFPGDPKSHSYKKSKKKLNTLFKKYSQKNKERKLIFIAHNVPNNCKLDKIRAKDAHPIVRGEHYGSKLVREMIDKYQPVIFIGGHMHENQGKCKIKKTLAIDAGPAVEGKATLIDFDENNGRINKVKFIK